ncbi:sarcosine oxidase subunit alpha, partial [Vibrio sp. M60_M31a]
AKITSTFMDWKQATVAGVPARIFRISFTGELSFEINVQANYGLHVWKKLMEHGAKYDITPYGTETMQHLACRKRLHYRRSGYRRKCSPLRFGYGWCVANSKPFSFIGKRGMAREETV